MPTWNDYARRAPTLRGDPVTLRTIEVERDAAPFHAMFLDPDMHRWTGNTVPEILEDSAAELVRYRDLPGLISWAVADGAADLLVGTYWIAPAVEDGRTVVTAEAQRIAKPYWRRGHTREARRLVHDFAFGVLGAVEVRAQAWEGNTASCRSMEAGGYRLSHTERRLFTKRGVPMTERHYVLDRETWLSRRTSR